eukprot:TRINITY_DN73431_c0_g1_i1.p1 TRINITY_DN73431_c0_g1~~TRINITY_DN73431_c0_g1_i1.p1  ORF type:complete len:689 (+),score=102.87 TRINITY_DN73431_c0_g1_i1:112-2178(+)
MLATLLWGLWCIISRCAAQDQLDSNFVAGDVTDDSTEGGHTYYVHDGLRVSADDQYPELQPIDAEPVAQDSPDKCMQFCDEEQTCQCAVFLTADKMCQRWRGCRRHPSGFVIDDSADTLMKVPTLRPRYKEHDGFNTHSASGSVDIDRGGQPARVESYQGCQDRCTVDDTCDCTVYATDGTYRCWKRQHCTDDSLMYDPTYTVYVKEGGAKVKLETTTAADLYGWTPPATTTKTTITSTMNAQTTKLRTTAMPTTTTKRATTRAATTTTTTTTEQKKKVAKSTTKAEKSTTHAPTTTTSTTTTGPPTFAPDERYVVTLKLAMPVPKDLLAVEIVSDLRRLQNGLPEVNTSDVSMLAWRRLRPSSPIGPEVLEKLGSELAHSKIHAAFATSVAAAMDVAVDKVRVENVGYGVAIHKLELDASIKYFIPPGSLVSDVEDLCSSIGRDSSSSAKSFKTSLGPNLKAVVDSNPKEFPLTAVLAKALLEDGSGIEVVSAHGQSMAPLTLMQRLTRAMTSFLLTYEQAIIIGVIVLVSFCTLWYLVANYGARGYQRLGAQSRLWGRSIASRLESRSARQLRVRQRVEKYAQKALDLLMAPEPEYQDSELVYLVRVLNRCRIHAKSLCGSPWGQWVKSGDCQTCKRRIDRAEKGLQCASGGHHLCWPCMVSIMDWENLAVQEGDSTWTWATKEWL